MEIERKDIDVKSVKDSKLPVFWMLGGPASGKTTQCAFLSKVKEYISICPADLISEEVKSGSTRGLQLSKLVEAGESVPSPIIIDLVAESMVAKLADFFGSPDGKAKGFVIDGFPNAVEEAQEFMARICPVTKIIYLTLDAYSMMERLIKNGCDNLEANEKACGAFQEKVMPLLEKYKDKVIKVDGSEMSFIITADINSALLNEKL